MVPHSEILTYPELCGIAGGIIQKGINVRYKRKQTILLMSQRTNAPYPDHFDLQKNVLYYVGHDVRKTPETPFPKDIDQPLLNEKGTPSDNSKLIDFVKKHKQGEAPEKIRIFEKIQSGIWADKGLFELIDYGEEKDTKRNIFVFVLKPIPTESKDALITDFEHTRLIPTEVKVEVWKRDKGECQL